MKNRLHKAIRHFGSQAALARALDVSPMAVSLWCSRNTLPAERCVQIERASGGAVTREHLRPDLWPRRTSARGESLNAEADS